MESNIAKKIQLLNYESDKYPMINKFMISLSDELISLEEVEEIVSYLASKGITITKPSQQKLLLNGLAFIQSQVERMESFGALGAYVEDPLRINDKGAFDRIEYLIRIGEPIVNAEGKFTKLPFKKRDFEAKYGVEYNVAQVEVEMNEPEVQQFEDFNVSFDDVVYNAETIDPVEAVEVEVPTWTEQSLVNETTAYESPAEIVEPDVPTWDESSLIIEDTAVPEVTEITEEAFNEEIIPVEDEMVYVDPIDEILSKPQTIGLNDVTLERYEKLYDSIRHILVSVYNVEEINDSITDNLIKLITNDVNHEMRDNELIYYAITWGKNITEEEVKRLTSAITEELEYTSILELDMGRVA